MITGHIQGQSLRLVYPTVAADTVGYLEALIGCQSNQAENDIEFVTTRDGRFYRGDTEYKFIGANFWYGAVLASEGQGGDRERLQKELDLMQEVGITNVRVLVGGEGPDTVASHVLPVLHTVQWLPAGFPNLRTESPHAP